MIYPGTEEDSVSMEKELFFVLSDVSSSKKCDHGIWALTKWNVEDRSLTGVNRGKRGKEMKSRDCSPRRPCCKEKQRRCG